MSRLALNDLIERDDYVSEKSTPAFRFSFTFHSRWKCPLLSEVVPPVLKGVLNMSARFVKPRPTFSLLFIITILLTWPAWLNVVDTAQAQSLNNRKANNVSPLLQGNKHKSDETVTVIVTLDGPRSGRLNALLKQNGVRQRREMKSLGSFSVTLPFEMVAELASFPEVSYVTSNEAVFSVGHVSSTTGSDAGKAAASAAGRGAIDGAGIGIAILDSGIDANHAQFAPASSRIRASVDFTGENRTDDPYGHGTFVAAAAAGGGAAGAEYTGIAPGVSLLNVRVLNRLGEGTVETVLAGLDWVAAHARQYNIRIVNLSLGTRAVDSYKYDVLCRAVRGLSNSGILVVVAAGNNGKNALGQRIYGAIHSPGIEPSALTVGASNTFQTNGRSDDGVATYSSRGPTRSYWIDEDGVTHHDNLLKPDMVAPGNKLVSAQARNNLLVLTNPLLNASGLLTDPSKKMMSMSGTSVATPIVSGTAALMIQLNPKLTPNMLKAFMEYSAQKLNGSGVLDQGAGQLNIEGSMRLALLTRQDLVSPVPVGLPLLTGAVNSVSSFAGSSFAWSGMIVRKFNSMSGTGLIERFQGPYATGELLGDGFLISDGLIVNRGSLFSGAEQLTNGDSLWTSNGFTADSLLISDDTLMSDAVDVSSQSIIMVGQIVSDSVLTGEPSVSSSQTYDGILLTGGILLSTGESLSNGSFINQDQLKGDGVLMGSGELIANGVRISEGIVS